MRQYRYVTAAFAADATTATYTEKALTGGGGVAARSRSGAYIHMEGAAMMSIGIPTGIAVGVDALRFQVAYNADGTWYDARDSAGELISVASVQTVKGDAVLVDTDMLAFPLVKIVPVDSGGDATAPGAITLDVGLKD